MAGWIKRSVARRVALLSTAAATLATTIVGLVVVNVLARDQPPSIRRALVSACVIGGVVTVVSVALATLVIAQRLLSRSLTDLTAAMRAAEKGQWLVRARSTRSDEIGELAGAFDKLCAAITDLSAHLIDNDRELAWTQQRLKLQDALSLLFELSQTIDAESDADALLAALPGRIAPALDLGEMAVLVPDDDGRFVARATFGIPEAAVGLSFPADDPICGQVARTGEPFVIADTAADPRYGHFDGRHPADGAFACVPMKIGGRLLGLFQVLRPKASGFPDADVRLLASLASYTALALAHARMTHALRDASRTDPLTGVPNRRMLMERAGRGAADGPLSALMIDVDHFKQVNDELGHAAGDDVLRALAGALAQHVPGSAYRYGGEEFVVLLPGADKPSAIAIAETLRAAAKALPMPGDRRLTVSIGVATLPGDAASENALIDAADRALLEAKRAGRDRVVATPETISGRSAAS